MKPEKPDTSARKLALVAERVALELSKEAEEKKTRRVGLLLRPSTWDAFSATARRFGYTPNAYAERVLSAVAEALSNGGDGLAIAATERTRKPAPKAAPKRHTAKEPFEGFSI